MIPYDSQVTLNFNKLLISRDLKVNKEIKEMSSFCYTSLSLFALVSIQWSVISQNPILKECLSQSQYVEVFSDADVFIGVLLNMHDQGRGIYGCGEPKIEGVETYGVLRWVISLLNQNSTVIDGQDVTETFIPGIKIGLKIYDICSHQGMAIKQLTDWFPELLPRSKSCSTVSNSSELIIGLLDMSGTTKQPHVIESLRDYVIPSISTEFNTAVPPDHLAMTIAEVAHDMEWQEVAVFHADDEHSIAVTRTLGNIATGGKLCIIKFEAISLEQNGKRFEAKAYRKLLNRIATVLKDNTPVIIISEGEIVRHLVKAMGDVPQTVSRFQWLFSWVPDTVSLARLQNTLNLKNVFSLAPYPVAIPQLEQYWSKLQDLAITKKQHDHWLLEYFMSIKKCRVPDLVDSNHKHLPICSNIVFTESPGQVLSRTAHAIPSVHALFTYAHALRKAWEIMCQGKSGVCPALRLMSHQEFVLQYLEPLEFIHSTENRSPPEISGRKSYGSRPGEIDYLHLGLTVYTYDATLGVKPQQLVFYDSVQAHVIDKDFNYRPSKCPKSGCNHCLTMRQGRLENSERETSEFFIIEQKADILIPILLPIHKSGSTLLECSTSINSDAIQDLEAALWILDKINSDPKILPGIRLGTVAIDTCGSYLKITQQLSSFLSVQASSSETIDVKSILAIISDTSAEESKTIEDIVTPLNITSVSTGDRLAGNRRSPYSFQIAVPATVRAKAIVEVLKHLGWSFISVVHSADEESVRGFQAFRTEAKKNFICISNQLSLEDIGDSEVEEVQKFNDTIKNLLEARKNGAKVVALWLNNRDYQLFFLAIQKAIAEEIIKQDHFIWLRNGIWGDDTNILQKYGNKVAGSLVFKQGQNDHIQEFLTYFRCLKPENNKRNPWFQKYWKQNVGYESEKCNSSLLFTPAPKTIATMQAIMAVTAGLSRLHYEVCQTEKGLCPRLLQQSSLRHLLNEYIRYTASTRLDEKEKMFMFTKDGVGDIPVEIFNLRRGIGNISSYKKVGEFHDRLSSLDAMVTYGSHGEEVLFEDIISECRLECSHCGNLNHNYLVEHSTNNLYLGATFGVHRSSKNPLACGKLNPFTGLQHVEAFLWALDQVNNDHRLLSGVTLGAVVFDTCGSRERASQEIYNFLSQSSIGPKHVGQSTIFSESTNQSLNQPEPANAGASFKLPSVKDVLGFVVGEQYEIVKPVVDLTVAQKLTTLASEVISTEFNNLNWYDYLLRLSLPANLIANAIVRIMQTFRWNYISVVYSSEVRQQTDILHNLKIGAEQERIQLALTEKAPNSKSSWTVAIQKLKAKKEEGARVVILLLSDYHLNQLLQVLYNSRKEKTGQYGHFVWVSYGNIEGFQQFPQYSAATICVRPEFRNVPAFQEYFQSLDIRNNSRNPWFFEYWKQVFRCRGAACYNRFQSNLRDVPFSEDPGVFNVVASVFALAHGLEKTRTTLCPGVSIGLCSDFKKSHDLREIIFKSTKLVQLDGLKGRVDLFTKNNYGTGGLEILIFRQLGINDYSFVKLGTYTEKDDLKINISQVRNYDSNGRVSNLNDVISTCLKSNICGERIGFRLPQEMKMVSDNSSYVITSLMSIHQRGETFFSCGSLNLKIFRIVALTFALEEVNKNVGLNMGKVFGALILDDCGSIQRAQGKLFRYLEDERENMLRTSGSQTQTVVTVLTFDYQVALEVLPIVQANGIPQVSMSPVLSTVTKESIIAIPTYLYLQISAVIALLQKYHWTYVNIILTNDEFGKEAFFQFSKIAKRNGVCMAQLIRVDISFNVKQIAVEMSKFFSKPNVNVVVLLTNETLVRNVIWQAAKETNILDRYIWIATESWKDDHNLVRAIKNTTVDAFVVKLENHDVPEFHQFFTNMTLSRHEPFPEAWFEEFWQHHFRCQLMSSLVVQQQYPNVCTGRELLSETDFQQEDQVYFTITTVKLIARALRSLLAKRCPPFSNIKDCEDVVGLLLAQEIKKVLKNQETQCEDSRCGSIFGYQIHKVHKHSDGQYSYKVVGLWKNHKLDLNEKDVTFSYSKVPTSVCSENCEKCNNEQDRLVYKPALYTNFKTIWGIIVTSLSLFGISLVVICTLYFLMVLPAVTETTKLGFLILFGILVLYGLNFAFILTPNIYTCGARRFLMGLAYAIIISGMLVKVMNAWRFMGYKNNRVLTDCSRLTRPTSLLLMVVGLVAIQVVLSTALLVLRPPEVDVYSQVWRCSPSTFENELVISLVYVMLLLALSILFSLLSWKSSDGNKESRWILLICILKAVVWLVWTVFFHPVYPQYRDVTIVVANLVCATIVMLCLHLRKVYLYSKLTRRAREKGVREQLQLCTKFRSRYGTLQKEGISLSFYGSMASLHKIMYGFGPFSPRSFRNAPSDGNSSNFSQVQGTDLYPLEMYSGGSQFQSAGVLTENEMLALNDNMTMTQYEQTLLTNTVL
ncbi:LOW QUALITY PROTEIN: uncharacterized protein LOC143244736 [Tachypleus tridentatus]|uniref:LOW QUALITY PROTEIN: uncharacterized protein LOC143244736 n=1 Tax=Tachypleus tridentatus TaxID=6853 RepID=UPI003FD0404D